MNKLFLVDGNSKGEIFQRGTQNLTSYVVLYIVLHGAKCTLGM